MHFSPDSLGRLNTSTMRRDIVWPCPLGCWVLESDRPSTDWLFTKGDSFVQFVENEDRRSRRKRMACRVQGLLFFSVAQAPGRPGRSGPQLLRYSVVGAVEERHR